MVDALRESHRVLKSDGLLIDLRPVAVQRRVGLTDDGAYRLRWRMPESFDDDRAADAAVAHVVRDGLFKPAGRERFQCYRLFDYLDDFIAWLIERDKIKTHGWLVRKLERELTKAETGAKIVVRSPLVLSVLKKLAGPAAG
ncbi:MAG TPA: hypothetical protein VJV05_07520 [Pyrinomonadaceae bacterium]|nr:hypothetical protein [Pyrinomonadaceae bacterium]